MPLNDKKLHYATIYWMLDAVVDSPLTASTSTNRFGYTSMRKNESKAVRMVSPGLILYRT